MTNPKRTQKPTKTPGEEEQKYMYLTVSAEVTYVDQVPPEGQVAEYKTEKVSIIYQNSEVAIPGKILGNINQRIYMRFHEDYAQMRGAVTRVVPEVVKIIFLNIIPLGIFTKKEFEAGVNLTGSPPEEPRKKE